jgi:TP901 family phage tail tape measure protein
VSDVKSTFSYDANFGPAQTQIRSLVKDITILNAAFKSLDNEANKVRNARAGSFMSSLGNIGGFNAQIVDLTSDVERFGKALQRNQLTLRQYYKEAAQAYKKNSMARRLAEDEVRRAQSQLVGMGQNQKGRQQGMLITPLTIDTSDINTKMAISQKQFSIFNKLVSDGATQLINWGKNTQWAGRQLTVGLTVPLTIFGSTVSKTFREVDKELTRFAKVYGSDLVAANQQATNSMRAQVEQLSKDFAGKYGIAAKETAGLAADLAATGLEGQKLLDSVAQTTRLAVLGEVDRQEAMKATLALQGAFNMSTTELAESINFLNAVENQTSASLQDLTEAIPRVGPVINSLGGDVKDLAVLLVAMKEGGVNAAEGANAIKSGLASLINPTRQASETAKQYGIDLDGIVKANKGKLMPTIMAFQEALAGLDSFAKAQIIEQLFGKYQFARISALFDNLNASGSQTVEVLKLMSASSQDLATIANSEIRTLTESSAMRFQRSMEAIKASLLPVGEALTNSVIPFIEKTANLINTLVEYSKGLPGPVKSFLKVATGFTLIAGPIIMLVGVFANFVGYITKTAMSITKLGAALAGLRTEKFEVLDDTQLAASKASDVLSSAYNNQKASLDKLNLTMEAYLSNLREEVRLSNQLFMPGTTAGRGPRGGGKKAKLAMGGQPYVPGSGSGDKVPALLEPGEFVVNKKATEKFGPLLEHINFKQAPRFQNGGPIGLIRGGGKPLFLGMPEKFSEKISNVRGLLKKSDAEAKTGRFASMEVTPLGTRVDRMGGYSSAIPGVNGVYEINGQRYVVKGHTDSDSALAEARGAQLTREIFGLKTPEQEVIKIAHPQTGELMFAVRSPYDEAFAKSSGKVDPEDFAAQALASIIRRDNDLQPDNLHGNVVSDVGAAFVADRASQPRTVGGPQVPVSEQALINFLAKKGGAKKWFAESTGDIARSMTADEYQAMFIAKIDDAMGRARGAIDNLPNMTPAEKKMYERIITDLEDARQIDWKSLHAHHTGLSPTVAKSPTAAALAKKQAEAVEKARQKGHAVGTGGMPWAYANGGFVKLIEGGKVPGYKALERLIANNAQPGSQASINNWLANTLDRIDNKDDAKLVVEALTEKLKTGTGLGRGDVITDDLLSDLGKKLPKLANRQGRLTRRPGRSSTGTGRPAEIAKIRAEQQKQINVMETAIRERLQAKGFSDSEIEKLSRVEAAHLSKETVIGKDGEEYKVWKPKNLSWMPQAENLAFEYLTRGGPTTSAFESALKEAGATPAQIKSILSGNHPTSGVGRQRFLSALGILESNGSLSGTKTLDWVRATNALNGEKPVYSPKKGIVGKNDPRYDESFTGVAKGKGTPAPKAVDAKTGRPATKKSVGKHQRGGRTVVIDPSETVADRKFVELAENGINDGTDIKAQRKAAMGNKAGAIGGLAMTGAFMLPAITGTNEALSKFTNTIMTAMTALSVLTTVMQVRGISGGGIGLGAKASKLREASLAYKGVAPQRNALGQSLNATAGMAQAKQQVGAGRVMGKLGSAALGAGKGGMLARGALGALAIGGPLTIGIMAGLAALTVAYNKYQESIINARKAGEALYASQTKAAEYFGIELKSVNATMQENIELAKQMGFAKGTSAAAVDPALKETVLQQEENQKIVEQLKSSADPAAIYLGQYGKMLQQGFTADQAQQILAVLAQASGKMDSLRSIQGKMDSATVLDKNGRVDQRATEKNATAMIEESLARNITAAFNTTKGSRTDPNYQAPLTSKQDFANLTGQFTGAITAALTSPDLIQGFNMMSKTIDSVFANATKTGTDIGRTADALAESAKAQAKNAGYEEGGAFMATLDEALTGATDKAAGVKEQFLLIQAEAAGIDLTTIIADLELSKEEAEALRMEIAGIETNKKINIEINSQIQAGMDAIDAEIQARTAYYDQLIVNNESAQESENERTKNFQKNMEKRNKAIQKEIKGIQRAADEQIKAKEKEIDAIEESSDKYLKALQNQKEESSFLATQGQTALGGLNALAGGDVIGFLQARDEMANSARENAQQSEIKKIEDITDARVTDIEKTIDAIKEKADAETQTLQDQLDANQELMDKESERHENRMTALTNEAQQIQKNKAAELNSYNAAKDKLQELMNLPVGDKLGKDLSAYATAISGVAANMPAEAQAIMKGLAEGFSNGFSGVFNQQLEAAAKEFDLPVEDLRKLIQNTLPNAGKDQKNGTGNNSRYATGGYVSGPGTSTSDSIPAQLSNGEYVVNADSVRRIGKGTLDKINNGYRVGGIAITSAGAVTGAMGQRIGARTIANALAENASTYIDEEPENTDGSGSGVASSIPEKLGKVARILSRAFSISARGIYPSGKKHSSRYSTAIDYRTPEGTPVYAMASGSASQRNRGNSSFGKFVTIKHGDGTESLYAHLNEFGKDGSVNAGDLIGYSGNTGNSTGPHLHFEWSALKNGENPPGMRVGGETMSDGLANLHKGEVVLTKPLTQQLKDGIAELKFGLPSMSSLSPLDSGTMVSSSNTYNISVDASGPSMDPNKIAQKIVTAISREEDRRSFGRSS